MSSYRPTVVLVNLFFAHEKKASNYSCNYHLWSYPQSTAKKFVQRYVYPRNWETCTLETDSAWNRVSWDLLLCCMCTITALRIIPGMGWVMAPQEGIEKPIQSSEGKDVLNFSYAHTWKVHVHVMLLSTLKIHAAMSSGNCSRRPQALLNCWMSEHLPCHLSVASLERNLSYRAQFQEILSQKSYSFISVSYLLLHNSTSGTTFDLSALQTVADHLQCSFLHRTVVFSLVSLSTVVSPYTGVWPEKHSHMKEDICHAL